MYRSYLNMKYIDIYNDSQITKLLVNLKNFTRVPVDVTRTSDSSTTIVESLLKANSLLQFKFQFNYVNKDGILKAFKFKNNPLTLVEF